MTEQDLTMQGKHFAFGENWADYAKGIGDAQIAQAENGLRRLLGGGDLGGKRFLDIGCGSGLHSLAALRLGASEVLAVDVDPQSVATTKSVLGKFAGGGNYAVEQVSVFDLDPARHGVFDTVYSWGVLHHTGDMARAMRMAAAMVKPGGQFVFALYRKTWMCPFWTIEKRWYSGAGTSKQRIAQKIYISLFKLGLFATGRRFENYVSAYNARGMDYYHDVHDWLGGYPYQSTLPETVETLMRDLGLFRVRSFLVSPKRKPPGVFGTGCDEYVYAKKIM
jgi:SAM-dependent methyltransferase